MWFRLTSEDDEKDGKSEIKILAAWSSENNLAFGKMHQQMLFPLVW